MANAAHKLHPMILVHFTLTHGQDKTVTRRRTFYLTQPNAEEISKFSKTAILTSGNKEVAEGNV